MPPAPPPAAVLRMADRLLAALLAVGLPAGLGAEEPLSHRCPFHEEALTREEREELRAPPPLERCGIRFSHASALTAAEMEAPIEKPYREERRETSAFHLWEFIQLGAILAGAVLVVWLAHRRVDD